MCLGILFSILIVLCIVELVSKTFKPNNKEKVQVVGKLFYVTSKSLKEYYMNYGEMPDPENGKVPKIICDYSWKYFAETDLKLQTENDKFIPFDPFAPSVDSIVSYKINIGMRSYIFSGDPLKYTRNETLVVLTSRGPDKLFENQPNWDDNWNCSAEEFFRRTAIYSYDSTNGAISGGDLFTVIYNDEILK